jgi:hypothetical protein
MASCSRPTRRKTEVVRRAPPLRRGIGRGKIASSGRWLVIASTSWLKARTYIYIYVCMYVCTYIYIYIYI